MGNNRDTDKKVDERTEEKTEEKSRIGAGWVISLVLCIIFGVVLVLNMIIIVKGVVNPDTPPSICGVTPLVVQSGSMSGTAEDHIEVGDLIFVTKADTGELEVGDVISFMKNEVVITHRIIQIDTGDDGGRLFTTKGDANNVEDDSQVTEDEVVGVYRSRIGGVGDFAMFLQKPLGMLVFIGIPMCIFIIYDIVSRQREGASRNKKTAEMEKELLELRALKESVERDKKEDADKDA